MRPLEKGLKIFLMSLAAIIVLGPILWMLLLSLLPVEQSQLLLTPDAINSLRWLPYVTLENYVRIFRSMTIFASTGGDVRGMSSAEVASVKIWNSIIVATGATLLAAAAGVLAAYGSTRYRFRRTNDLAFWILSNRFMPPVAAAIPLFLMFDYLGIIDTYFGLIVAHSAIALPFSFWITKGFFEELPRDYEEAAVVDGCSRLGAFIRIVLPLSRPALVASLMFGFISSWNEFLLALLVTRHNVSTAPLEVVKYAMGYYQVEWGNMAAYSITMIIIPFLIAVGIQKYLIRGLTLGTLRG